MNFAAFAYLANGLTTYRLDRTCWSVACAHRPIIHIPPNLINQVLYPPDPESPITVEYNQIISEIGANLSGVARRTGSPDNPARST